MLLGIAHGVSPLLQAQRPPRQTPTQRDAHARLLAEVKKKSEAARPWVLAHLNESRPKLHVSLQHLSDEELLERLDWEFRRLPIIHNAPLGDGDASWFTRAFQDDTGLDITLQNGYLQNPCQRGVFGSNERFDGISYVHYFRDRFGMPPDAYPPKWKNP